jgi:prepilin-type N-terminal cleavage/methylation domain-containing protein/prepilin-type processing-associated H-X9-DG protein
MALASKTSAQCLLRSRIRRYCRYDSAAFTLVELLVVITIIGMLVAMLLPAVQAAREASRRSQCANNMRQLSLAVLNYESSHKLLPPAGIAQVTKDKVFDIDVFNPFAGTRFSWIVEVLPFLEEQALYDKFDHSKQIPFQDQNPQATSLPKLLCPSDEAGPRHYDYREVRVAVCAKGNYAAYVSPFHIDLQMIYPGALVADRQRIGQISGGVSPTLLLSEVRTLDHVHDQRGAWALPLAGASLLAFDMHPIDWPYEHSSSITPPSRMMNRARYVPNLNSIGKTQPPNGLGLNKDTLIKPDCDEISGQGAAAGMPCNANLPPGATGYMSAAPRSLHPGGVNAAYLDGHTSFLENDVDEVVMALAVSVTD